MIPAAEDMGPIAAGLNRLPFVTWDRYITYDGYTDVYGWIDRADGRADFVLVTFERDEVLTFATSSAARSREIARILLGTDQNHIDCRRVDRDFGDMVNRTASVAA